MLKGLDINNAQDNVPSNKRILVFVYGTLMKGRCNHHYLLESEFLGNGRITGFSLYDLGSYPGVKHCNDGIVLGEVYKINKKTLDNLDMLEDEGELYTRETTKVIMDSEELEDVYVYIYKGKVLDQNYIPIEKQPWGK